MAACLLLLWHLEDTPKETAEDRTTEKVATVLISLLAMLVSTATQSEKWFYTARKVKTHVRSTVPRKWLIPRIQRCRQMLSSLLTLRDIHELLIEFFIKNDKKAYHGHVNSILFLKTERHHRCESTIIGLVVDWKRAKDNKLSVSILSTDMSKASVWRSTCFGVTCTIANVVYESGR